MNKYSAVFILGLLLLGTSSWADIVYLKDGRVFEGKIVDKNSYSIKIEVNGNVEFFYSGQVDRIVEDKKMGQEVKVTAADFTDIPQSKVDAIIHLVQGNGLAATLQRSVEDAIKNSPEDRREEFKRIFNFDEILKILIPIFDTYYNEAEINELIKIYQMPVRQKEIKNTPPIMRESMEAIVKYVQEKVKE